VIAKVKLTDKQEMFCSEYIVDLNATQAAIRAEYSEKTANRIASQLLSKLDIQERIAELMAARSKRVEINADWVLMSAKQVFDRCMQHEKVTDKLGASVLDNDGNPIYKFEPNAANKSLEIIGKHVKVRAFERDTEPANKDTTIELHFTDAVKQDED
jgi:phage terminase small subunit